MDTFDEIIANNFDTPSMSGVYVSNGDGTATAVNPVYDSSRHPVQSEIIESPRSNHYSEFGLRHGAGAGITLFIAIPMFAIAALIIGLTCFTAQPHLSLEGMTIMAVFGLSFMFTGPALYLQSKTFVVVSWTVVAVSLIFGVSLMIDLGHFASVFCTAHPGSSQC